MNIVGYLIKTNNNLWLGFDFTDGKYTDIYENNIFRVYETSNPFNAKIIPLNKLDDINSIIIPSVKVLTDSNAFKKMKPFTIHSMTISISEPIEIK